MKRVPPDRCRAVVSVAFENGDRINGCSQFKRYRRGKSHLKNHANLMPFGLVSRHVLLHVVGFDSDQPLNMIDRSIDEKDVGNFDGLLFRSRCG